jgi:hypothetical protein
VLKSSANFSVNRSANVGYRYSANAVRRYSAVAVVFFIVIFFIVIFIVTSIVDSIVFTGDTIESKGIKVAIDDDMIIIIISLLERVIHVQGWDTGRDSPQVEIFWVEV